MNGNSAALASLICGIAAILLNMCGCGISFVIPILGFIPMGLAGVLSIVALISGFLGLKNANMSGGEGKGFAIGGMVIGGLNLLLTLVGVVLMIFAGAAIAALMVGGSAL